MKAQNSVTFSDYIGITSAFICLIHCLAAPVLMGLGLFAHSHDGDGFWLNHAWDYVFLAIGLVAVWFSAEHTHQKSLKGLLWVTYGLLVATILLGHISHLFQYLAFVASGGLIFAHLLNIRESLRQKVVSRVSESH